MTRDSEEYGWGEYAGFRVLIMRENGYINASQLCKDGGRTFQFWLVLQKSKDLAAAVAKDVGVDKAIISKKHPKEYRGVYVHIHLMINIINWISAEYAFKLTKYLLRSQKVDPVDALVQSMQDMSIDTYKRIKRTPLADCSKTYTLSDIVNLVQPVVVMTDLTKGDVRRALRGKIGTAERGGVYMLFNKKTNEYYIGSSKNVVTRASGYFTDSYAATPSTYKNLIKEAIVKHTKAAFALLILELSVNSFEREKYYIDMLDPKYNTDLYKRKNGDGV